MMTRKDLTKALQDILEAPENEQELLNAARVLAKIDKSLVTDILEALVKEGSKTRVSAIKVLLSFQTKTPEDETVTKERIQEIAQSL